MNKKHTLCLIYNSAPHYREGIFRLIEKEYNCHWYFGPSYGNIKRLDTSFMHNYTDLKQKTLGLWYWQKGVQKLLRQYETFFMLAESRCLSTWLFMIRKVLFYPKKKVYFWGHGWYGKETKMENLVKKCYVKMADGEFVYGNYAKQLMTTQKLNPNKIFVVHNSLNYDKQLSIRKTLHSSDVYQSHFENSASNLIFIGRLTEVKRLDLLIDAIKMLQEAGLILNVTLVGDGAARSRLEQQIHNANLDNNVWFYGACYDDHSNAQLLYDADLCVAPGNVGLTAMHAMVFGCPVVTHNNYSHQMPEFEAIKDGETGTFFEYNNVSSIADCIKFWILSKSNVREKVRESCYQEIDTQWTPEFQMNVFKQHLIFV